MMIVADNTFTFVEDRSRNHLSYLHSNATASHTSLATPSLFFTHIIRFQECKKKCALNYIYWVWLGCQVCILSKQIAQFLSSIYLVFFGVERQSRLWCDFCAKSKNQYCMIYFYYITNVITMCFLMNNMSDTIF